MKDHDNGPRAGAVHRWVHATRPRTLTASVSPVLVGTALAASEGAFQAASFACALVASVALQVGANLANDYSDARRGADSEKRVGPPRAVASGAIGPREVLAAAWAAFAVAAMAGLYLAAVTSWWLLAFGAASILAAVLYTGGPWPYGYAGLGEVSVFLFFGLEGVVGSYWVQAEELHLTAFALAVPVGLLTTAILVVNNLRDIAADRAAGKRTLAVVLGARRTRTLYVALICLVVPALSFCIIAGASPWVVVALVVLPAACSLAAQVAAGARGQELNRVLAHAALLQFAFSGLTAAGLLLR